MLRFQVRDHARLFLDALLQGGIVRAQGDPVILLPLVAQPAKLGAQLGVRIRQ